MKPKLDKQTFDTIRQRLWIRLDNHLSEMQGGYDDSITGFNEAWDVMRKLLEEIEAEPGEEATSETMYPEESSQ